MTTSGTYDFEMDNADVVLEAFDRCEIRPPAITGAHMISAKRSLNLELQRWANIGINLWTVELITIPLIQGVATYDLPAGTVSLLDTYIRTFSLTGQFNATPNFSTVALSKVVNIIISNHGLNPGGWINIVTPVVIGGLLLQGYFQVNTVVNPNEFTILSPVAASSTVSNGGVLPLFTAVAGQVGAQVTLPGNTYVQGDTFVVGAPTMVGGVLLTGQYTVTGVIDANNFGINVNSYFLTSDSVYENYGLSQIQFEAPQSAIIDNIMTPFGRTDYAQIPDKACQGKPTSYWLNRQINPQISLWQVPDQNGPYQLQAYRVRRIQDASPTMGQTPEIPYRFYDAFCAQLARRFAIKYAKNMLTVLEADAKRAWDEAAIEDRERADIMILPMLDGYYRD